jgi:hypothetical protein
MRAARSGLHYTVHQQISPNRGDVMSSNTAHFLKLIKVEFEDIQEDIGLMEIISMDRLKNAEITNYVYHENFVVFEQERRAIHTLSTLLDENRWEEYDQPDALRDDLISAFELRIRELHAPMAVHDLIKRKIDKIHQFILS